MQINSARLFTRGVAESKLSSGVYCVYTPSRRGHIRPISQAANRFLPFTITMDALSYHSAAQAHSTIKWTA